MLTSKLIDCCDEKRIARNQGLFEGLVGDDWYICSCRRQIQRNSWYKIIKQKIYHKLKEE